MAGAYFVSQQGLDDVMQVQLEPARSYTLDNSESIDAETRETIKRELRESQREIEPSPRPREADERQRPKPKRGRGQRRLRGRSRGRHVGDARRARSRAARPHQGRIGPAESRRRRLDLRLRPRGLRLPLHGPGEHRRRQLRPGDRQRPEHFRAGPDRAHSRASSEQIKRDFGFEPDFVQGKHYLEANDSAGNTFKATAKPVLIGTAVVGATTMIFAIILLLGKAGLLQLSLTDAPVLLGFICGGVGDLLVLRRLDAGRDDRRLSGGRVHQEEHGPHQEGGRHRTTRSRS